MSIIQSKSCILTDLLNNEAALGTYTGDRVPPDAAALRICNANYYYI